MCSPATCPACGKATWTGCGNHVEQALAGIAPSQRCQGHSSASGASASNGSSMLGRLFSR